MTTMSDLPALAELRHQKGLSLEDVSALTAIPSAKLKAIDSLQFEKLGTPTFAMGYIRSYAKAIGADADSYIDAYKRAVSLHERDDEPVVAPTSPSVESSKTTAALFIGGALIGLVVLLVLWLMQDGEPSSNIGSVGEPLELVKSGAEEGYGGAEDRSPKNELAVIESSSIEQVTQADLTSDESALDEVALDEVADRATFERPEMSEPVTRPVQDSDTSDNSSQVTVGESSESETLSVAITQDELVFTFADECWTEVKDGTGEVIFADIRNKGDNLRLLGVGPFNILLGNAAAVTLMVNGVEKNVSPIGSRRTRRIQLSP